MTPVLPFCLELYDTYRQNACPVKTKNVKLSTPMIGPEEIESFTDQCRKEAAIYIKRHIIDIIMGRTLEEKINSHCHFACIAKLGIKNFKRLGRWAFRPVLGFTEIFSTAFSLISLALNIFCHHRLVLPRLHKSPLKRLIRLHYYISNLTLFSSALLHTYENEFTRNADYFTAFLSLLFGLIIVVNRTVFYSLPKARLLSETLTISGGVLFFAIHVYKMLYIKFDYTYNKITCGIMFVFSCLGDCLVILRHRNDQHVRWVKYYMICALLGGAIELLDISPLYFLLDSHAVWHLMMALSIPFLARFLAGDIDKMAELQLKHEKKAETSRADKVK